jgi:lysophospholipase L1-like esterase
MRFLGRTGVALVLLAGLSGLGAASPPAGLEYVALGDSYTSGLGLAPGTELPVPECAQSEVNYPHRIAEQLGLDLTDVSCSGATTADIDEVAQHDGAPRQLDALSDSTDVVTLTIGGNDLGFVTVAATCAAASADGPLLQVRGQADCASYFAAAGADNPSVVLADQVEPALDDTFAAIAEAAPNARVFVLGYPNLFRDAASIPAGGCFTELGTKPSSFPIGTTDVAYLHGIETELDNTIQAASAGAGFSYVSTFADSEGHDICAGADEGYVNGAIVSGFGLAAGSMHPNERGAAFLAAEAAAAIEASLAEAPASVGEEAGASAAPFLVGGALLLLAAAGVAVFLLAKRGRARVTG